MPHRTAARDVAYIPVHTHATHQLTTCMVRIGWLQVTVRFGDLDLSSQLLDQPSGYLCMCASSEVLVISLHNPAVASKSSIQEEKGVD